MYAAEAPTDNTPFSGLQGCPGREQGRARDQHPDQEQRDREQGHGVHVWMVDNITASRDSGTKRHVLPIVKTIFKENMQPLQDAFRVANFIRLCEDSTNSCP